MKAPRQSDVARLAGVSQSAVSRVVSGEVDRIPVETRDRILAAVKELGYVPNAAARNLRNKRNRLLGVHTFEAVFPHARENFYFEFLLGIEERAEEIGYDLVLFTSTGTSDGRRRIYRDGTNRLNLADGTVLLGAATDREELARLWHDGYLFVHIGRREVPGADIPCIIPDYVAAADRLVTSLADRGHRHFAYLREAIEQEAYVDRRAGYRTAVERLGLRDRSPGFRGETGLTEEWLDELVAGPETAVVAEGIRLAEELRAGLAARGRSIPEDLSVAVLEGSGDEPGHRWDCLVIPRKEIGRIAIDALVARVEDPEAEPVSQLVACDLVAGETVAAPSVQEHWTKE
ncbi:DNA-binding LacI/PurR family transcriptional regulator [Kribbella aluminosa]|uniref:DNA-binding LacI/PurR family transcriptional regulator n=1 Tax=Kribbella aluminosa TaxID=416017 RepID=A0ABS4UH86_9ACTN|nr:LacI family DNA-binding transcriptional regulator [Kribbella aluminosa]MBP2350921.1 DNA-binding LacI/PurR family transcriptional regulator [Kribbella aluminosa]